jgi:hypothetical protein
MIRPNLSAINEQPQRSHGVRSPICAFLASPSLCRGKIEPAATGRSDTSQVASEGPRSRPPPHGRSSQHRRTTERDALEASGGGDSILPPSSCCCCCCCCCHGHCPWSWTRWRCCPFLQRRSIGRRRRRRSRDCHRCRHRRRLPRSSIRRRHCRDCRRRLPWSAKGNCPIMRIDCSGRRRQRLRHQNACASTDRARPDRLPAPFNVFNGSSDPTELRHPACFVRSTSSRKMWTVRFTGTRLLLNAPGGGRRYRTALPDSGRRRSTGAPGSRRLFWPALTSPQARCPAFGSFPLGGGPPERRKHIMVDPHSTSSLALNPRCRRPRNKADRQESPRKNFTAGCRRLSASRVRTCDEVLRRIRRGGAGNERPL